MNIKKFIRSILRPIFESAINQLIRKTRERYPELEQAVLDGIRTYEDKDMPGVEKGLHVAMLVMDAAPAFLRALPDAKSFFIRLVASVFEDEFLEPLEAAARKALKAL